MRMAVRVCRVKVGVGVAVVMSESLLLLLAGRRREGIARSHPGMVGGTGEEVDASPLSVHW